MPYFDRFDICEAYNLFATYYHGGQWTETYRIFGRLAKLKFKPSRGAEYVDGLTENGRAIFDQLVEREGFKPWPSDERLEVM